jgi:sulfur-carrier protein adenylyltransferase/sulfurtransferase
MELRKARDEIAEIDVETARRRHDDPKALFVDIREPMEWVSGFIPGATLLPQGRLLESIAEIAPDRSREIVLYCARGNRSARAAKALGELGYANVVSVAEGFNGWTAAGHAAELPDTEDAERRARYSRHFLIPEVGEAGQERLLNARILLIGAGGLGSPAALYLAAAGIGTIGIVDDDAVDASNLQRQVVHSTPRLGEKKARSAQTTIEALNPDVEVRPYVERLTSENVDRILDEGWDVIVDGADNFPTRYLLNDASVWHDVPVVHGSIFRFEGQVTVFAPGRGAARGAALQGVRASRGRPSEPTGRTVDGEESGLGGPCYRCLFPTPPPPELAPSCAEGGVLGVLPGVIGSLQTSEALKLVLGIGEPLIGRLLLFDALSGRFDEVSVRRDPDCPVCGEHPKITEYIDYAEFCSGRTAPV